MKDVFTTVRERRTIRRFSAAPVEEERIVSLLNEAAGLYEAEGTPHWRCLYFGTPESREELTESMTAKVTGSRLGKLLPAPMIELLKKQITGTPAHVIFIAESAGTERERDENYAAVCSIMQTFQLLGWEQGLGMLWYTDPVILSESFYKLIGWREGERFAGILEIGYFDKVPRGRKRKPPERSWTTIGKDSSQLADTTPFSAYNVLRLLNEAVWAPNDGMREPWRFIYVTGDKTEATGRRLFSEEAPSPPFLLVVAREETDPHKQNEDYAAVCSLIQNFQLLAQSEGWRIRRRIPEWSYDRKQCESFGLRPLERIVAVLEAGQPKRYSNSGFRSPAVKITIY